MPTKGSICNKLANHANENKKQKDLCNLKRQINEILAVKIFLKCCLMLNHEGRFFILSILAHFNALSYQIQQLRGVPLAHDFLKEIF